MHEFSQCKRYIDIRSEISFYLVSLHEHFRWQIIEYIDRLYNV